MRRAFLAAALAIGAAVTSFATAVPASAQVIVVLPGESIQEAVHAAQPGDTIIVQAGEYRESVSIRKDDITIQGAGASDVGTVLLPPTSETRVCGRGAAGFCMLGFKTSDGVISNTNISGFKIDGFPAFGIIVVAGEGAVFENNLASNDGEYGIAAFDSTRVRMIGNTATGNGEAGLYVGDSRRARATIQNNQVFGNGAFGIFLRDAAIGDVSGNDVHDNCTGIMILNTPGPVNAGRYDIHDNSVRTNNEFCPGFEEEGFPPTSGNGVAVVGGRRVQIHDNDIRRNRPSDDVPFHGGVVIISFPGGSAPRDNEVRNNVLFRNRPNVFSDGTGSGNVVEGNVCTPDC
jgi:parallel beta-helix repeat protein